MFDGYYRKHPYRPCLKLGPIGGYGGMYAPDWMIEKALHAEHKKESFDCQYPCGECKWEHHKKFLEFWR